MIYIEEGNIVIENENEVNVNVDKGRALATIDDIEFGICCGEIQLELNKVYEVQEGFLMLETDEDTLDFDYILIKR